ncbi:MFS transporter [Actinomadura rupiterrae]|uniref:MFS transporter n=1 Tax=Actinomadura rupiterrae TaxID=559627 RepID=UPI0020A4711F|nr:MFS transporter [Actinomadura rupiterrae]MCP2338948.1 MFS family permease [Actinomadura rupiterrae]
MSAVATSPATSAAQFTPRERAILLVLLGAGFMLSVDFSILNVALPRIGSGVGLDVTQLPWVNTAFVLPAAGFTLVCGRLADLFGRRRMLLAGMVVLVAGSLLGGLATSPGPLLAGRVLQGFATAMTLPTALSLLTTTFAEGIRRDRVLGLNGALLSGGFTVGALAGGTLVGLFSWRAAFLLNLPVAVAIMAATPFLIAESRVSDRVRLDLPGAVTVSGGLLAVVYAVIEKSPQAAVAGALLLVLFWLVERRSSAPLVAPRILVPALFIGFLGHVPAIVAFTVTATSGLPDEDQGLATGLTSMTQQIGLTLGIPVLSAIAATRSAELSGIHLALLADVAISLASVALVWTMLRPQRERRSHEQPHRQAASR